MTPPGEVGVVCVRSGRNGGHFLPRGTTLRLGLSSLQANPPPHRVGPLSMPPRPDPPPPTGYLPENLSCDKHPFAVNHTVLSGAMSSSPPTLGDVGYGFPRARCADSPFTATPATLVTGSHVEPALSVPPTFMSAVAPAPVSSAADHLLLGRAYLASG
jgi:hypothetical protein